MKTLFNNRGISLVVLLVAMTLIAVLGAGFVSLVSMKQRGFLHQRDSYRALNMANAGMEYAIRYISDQLRDTRSQYFQTPGAFQASTSPVIQNMSPNESFSYWYDPAGDVLKITGSYMNSTRQVNLSNFRSYMDSITLRYDSAPLSVRRPRYDSGSIVIPISNNNKLNINVFGIDITVPANEQYLQQMYFSEVPEIHVYNYQDDIIDNCPKDPSLPCKDTVGIRLPASIPTTLVFTEHTPHSIPGNTRSSFRILFDLPGTFSGTYTVLFRYTIGTETTPRATSITFVI